MNEIDAMVEILKGCCDREWSNETPMQVAQVVANAIHWRDQEIARLTGVLAEAAAHVNQTLSELEAMRG